MAKTEQRLQRLEKILDGVEPDELQEALVSVREKRKKSDKKKQTRQRRMQRLIDKAEDNSMDKLFKREGVQSENIKFTTWSPDTCGCVLVYAWDSAAPPEEREMIPCEVVHTCPCHSDLADSDDAHYSVICDENQLKNRSVNAANPDDPRSVEWSFTPGSRELNIKVPKGKRKVVEAENKTDRVVNITEED